MGERGKFSRHAIQQAYTPDRKEESINEFGKRKRHCGMDHQDNQGLGEYLAGEHLANVANDKAWDDPL